MKAEKTTEANFNATTIASYFQLLSAACKTKPRFFHSPEVFLSTTD
jgi:hypothetical protein